MGAAKGKGSDSGAEPFGRCRRTVDCYAADHMDHDRVWLECHVLFLWHSGLPVDRGAGRDRLCGHVVWLDGRPRARLGPCLAFRNNHVPHGAETHIKTAQGVKISVPKPYYKFIQL